MFSGLKKKKTLLLLLRKVTEHCNDFPTNYNHGARGGFLDYGIFLLFVFKNILKLLSYSKCKKEKYPNK